MYTSSREKGGDEKGGDIQFSSFCPAADTKVKMYTTLLRRGGGKIVHQTSREPSACILESVDAGKQGPGRIEAAL